MHRTTYKRKQALLRARIAKARKQHKKSSHLIREMRDLELKFYGGYSGIIKHVWSSKKVENKLSKALNASSPMMRILLKKQAK